MQLYPFVLAALCAAPVLAVASAPLQGASAKPAAQATALSAEEAKLANAQRPSYPLASCVVSGEELGSMGAPYETVVDGHLVRLCCKSCLKQVQADPAKVVAAIEAAVVKQQRALYPLDACPVSGEPLGADAVDVVVGTRLVRTCCAKCAKAVRADASAALAKVDAGLIQKQRPVYPLATCVVSGEPLEDAHEFLYGVRLVRTCCARCEQAFRREPEKFLAQLDAAKAKASAPADTSGLKSKD